MERLPFRNPVVPVPPQWAGLPQVAPTEQDVYAMKFLYHAYAFMRGARNKILATQLISDNQPTCMEMAGIIQMGIIGSRSGGIWQ